MMKSEVKDIMERKKEDIEIPLTSSTAKTKFSIAEI
jgi:hypothetical protein